MLISTLAALTMAASASELPKYKEKCHTKACHTRVAHKKARKKKLRAISSYKASFLGPVGACESGTTHNLKHGLRAISPSGQYRGRYQFGLPDYHRAGGHGDPVNADWLEQAYRAVVWLKINGRQSWPNC